MMQSTAAVTVTEVTTSSPSSGRPIRHRPEVDRKSLRAQAQTSYTSAEHGRSTGLGPRSKRTLTGRRSAKLESIATGEKSHSPCSVSVTGASETLAPTLDVGVARPRTAGTAAARATLARRGVARAERRGWRAARTACMLGFLGLLGRKRTGHKKREGRRGCGGPAVVYS